MNYESLFVVLKFLCHFKTIVIHSTVLLKHLKDCIFIKIFHLIIYKLEEFELHLGHTVKQNFVFLQVKLILSILKHVELNLKKPCR